ncbi:MAG: CYTH domain-containing protein [Saccharofermentans sp.]|nr:CYTH domain-containing protein [Saccharofermentans sp.]
METEVKLGFKDKESLFKFAESDVFRKLCKICDDITPVYLENSYLDTNSLTLNGRDGMVRVRHYSAIGIDEYEFTVKCGGKVSGGLHQRMEWNVKSDTGLFSISEFKNKASGEDPVSYLDEIFEGLTDDDLKVICCNSFCRTVFELNYYQSRIEACMDYGTIRGSDPQKTEEICELELELISGDINDLNKLADKIIKEADCHPLDATKYRRTLALAMG